jgi:hypothetical protein
MIERNLERLDDVDDLLRHLDVGEGQGSQESGDSSFRRHGFRNRAFCGEEKNALEGM